MYQQYQPFTSNYYTTDYNQPMTQVSQFNYQNSTASSTMILPLEQQPLNYGEAVVDFLYKKDQLYNNYNLRLPLEKALDQIGNYSSSPFIKKGYVQPVNINGLEKHTGFYDFRNFIFDGRSQIGVGAFAKVYRATHANAYNRTFAIKHINLDHLLSKGEKPLSVRREIETQMSFHHPNIVELYTFYATNRDVYMIMEDMTGGTLFDRIQANWYLSEDMAFKYFIQVASGLYFLHSNGYVHRDIKPENLLFDNKDHIKLCDFGWCVQASIYNGRTSFCGTAEYMAPEIIRLQPYAQPVDMWALGVLLYEMLHGYSPFRDTQLKINRDGNVDYNPVYQKILDLNYVINPRLKISNECKDMIRNLLNPDPNTRLTAEQVFNHPWVKKYEGVNLDNLVAPMQSIMQRKGEEKPSVFRNKPYVSAIKYSTNSFNSRYRTTNSNMQVVAYYNSLGTNILYQQPKTYSINTFNPHMSLNYSLKTFNPQRTKQYALKTFNHNKPNLVHHNSISNLTKMRIYRQRTMSTNLPVSNYSLFNQSIMSY